MRLSTVAALLLLSASSHAEPTSSEHPFADDVRRAGTANAGVHSLADGCVVTSTFCDRQVRGKLGVGDCTSSVNGTFFDVYEFAGTAGQLVEIDVRPLASSLTNPNVILVPPVGDASKTPQVFGAGGGVSAFYVLSSTGNWRVGVGTEDLFASGEYLISVQCFVDDQPSAPQNCVVQELLCNQGSRWYLTSQSCRFGGTGANRLFAPFEIYGVAGDIISVEVISSDFRPLFGIYDNHGNLLFSATTASSTQATGTFVFPATAFYEIDATSTADLATGFFQIKATCGRSGCLWPIITSQTRSVTAPYLSRVSLAVEVNGTDPMTVTWFETSPNIGTVLGTGRTFLSQPVTHSFTFEASAVNACGSWTSAPGLVAVTPPQHSRAVKH